MADQTLTCRDCGDPFPFSAGEQEFYQSKGLSTPSRCPNCRTLRKQQRSSEGRGSGRGGGGGGGGSSFGASSRDRQLFEATCADCGNVTQVPFRPRGVRPVYCRDCFERHR